MDATGTRRVFIEDERRDGKFLRMTWHPDRRSYVVSTWDGTVCVGATRIGVDAAPELIGVLAHGLADAARPSPVAAPTQQRLTLREHVRIWWRQRVARAAVLEIRHARSARSAGSGRETRRSA
jgi:hypothetical protein